MLKFTQKGKENMSEKIIRMRIPDLLYKKFKIICAERDLSMPKQTAQLIRKFVEIDEENKRLMKHLKKD